MPLASNLRFHDYQFEHALPVGKWRWTTRLDVSGAAPSYSIRDVISPFGLLRDSIPLPGDVVQSMAQSIEDLKSNFAPSITVGPPESLTFNVDEGRGFSAGQALVLSNGGVFGSLLGATLTTSAPYVRVNPTYLGNLASRESGTAMVEVDATSLVASSSPYQASIAIQDASATNNPRSLPLTINVRPKATTTASTDSLIFEAEKPLQGGFSGITPQTFTVQNTGPSGSVLDFTVKRLTGRANWLSLVTPLSGSLVSGQTATISVTVAPPSNILWGSYFETLRISGYGSNAYVDVEIQLVIS